MKKPNVLKTSIKSLAVAMILGLTSCTTYQYVSVGSNISLNTNKEFVQDEDSVRFQYDFNGENCPVNILVYNKSNRPLYVDWSQSSVVMNGQTLSMKPSVSKISGDIEMTEIKTDKYWGVSDGTLNGSITHPENFSFIPPHASIDVTPINLVNEFLTEQSADSIVSALIATSQGNVKVRKHIYNAEQTPLKFRCYITYADNQAMVNSIHSDQEFWVSESYRSMSKPLFSPTTQFHVTKITGFGSFMLGATCVILILVSAAAGGGA